MPLSLTSLNGDSAFLLTFTPSSNNGATITVLLDPWLHSPASIIHPRFASQSLIAVPVISSLSSLASAKLKSAESVESATEPAAESGECKSPPDAILLSQADSDHCSPATLSEYPWSLTPTEVFCSSESAGRIRSWPWWREAGLDGRLRILKQKKPLVLTKVGFTTAGESTSGESKLEVELLEAKYPWQIPSVHSAIAITFSSHEEVIRVLFSPHGSPWGCVKSWVGNKKLDLLLWPWHHVNNPWWLGGEVAAGFECGRKVCEATEVSHWVASHDDDKEVSGWVTRWMVTRFWGEEKVREQLRERVGLWRLKAGEVMTVGGDDGGR